MDLSTWDDPKVCRGIEILEGAVDDHTSINVLLAEADDAEEDTKGKKAKGGKREKPQGPTGLDLGRRLLVVLNAPAEKEKEKSKKGEKAKGKGAKTGGAARIIDHGSVQKEAVRRLFDAQVLLRAYEEQLQEKEQQVKDLFMEMQEKKTKAQRMRNMAEVAEEAEVVVQNAEGAPTTAAPTTEPTTDAGQKKVIPYWLRNDKVSREEVTRLKDVLMSEIMAKSDKIEAATVSDILWEIGLAFAMRWAGGPDEALIQQSKAMEQKFKDIQRSAMQESAMLRGHARKVEARFRATQKQAKLMKQALGQATRHIQDMQRMLMGGGGGGGGGGGPPKGQVVGPGGQVLGPGPPGAPGAPLHPVAHQIVQGWAGQGGGAPPARGSGFGGVGFDELDLGGGDFGGGNRGSRGSISGGSGGFNMANFSSAMSFDFDQAMDGPPTAEQAMNASKSGHKMPSLADDDTLGFGCGPEELEQIDHEVFEPLNSFDDDVRELLIDTVNEKVRRILSLDPSKFVGGKLPFGLRPDKTTSAEDALEEEIRRLTARVKELEDELQYSKDECEELRRKIDLMRQRAGLPREAPAEAPPPAAAPEPEQPRRRPPEEPKAEAPPPQVIMQGFTEQEVQQRINDALKEWKDKVAMLENRLKQRQQEIDELKRKIQELSQPKKEPKKEEPKVVEKKPDESPALRARIAELEDKLRKAEKERDDAYAEIAELQGLLEEARNKPPEIIEKLQEAPPPPEIDTRGIKRAQELLMRVLLKVGGELEVPATAKGQTAAQKLLGKEPGRMKVEAKQGQTQAQVENDVCNRATPPLAQWTEDILGALEGLGERIADLQNQPPPAVKEVVAAASPREGKCYNKAHASMPKKIKELEAEVARLLLIINELRERVEHLQDRMAAAEDENAEWAKSAMANSGLKELAGARRNVHQLKGVFQRLFQDSVQRIQRCGMVQERAAIASKAYNFVVSTTGAADGFADSGGVPDFERLHETTQATLQGMWYNVEKLFMRTCEYAMCQGVDSTVPKDLSAELDADMAFDDEPLRPPQRSRPRGDLERMPAKRPARPRALGGAPGRGPKDLVEAAGAPQSFHAYVAQIRDAQSASARSEEWAQVGLGSPGRPRGLRPESAAALDNFKTLRDACSPGNSGGGSLLASKSLPALPKGRGFFQSGDSPGGSTGRAPFSPSAAAPAVLV